MLNFSRVVKKKGENMKKALLLFAFCILLGTNQANAGFLYQDTITPIIATNMETENIKELKCGECQIFHCMGIIDTGHAGIQEAARRGKINKIHHVDVATKTFLGIGMTTVKVYGE